MRAASRAWFVGLAVFGTSALAWAAPPRLDELAATRGIAAGELDLGARVVVPAGSRAQVRAERRGLSLHGIPLRHGFETVWIDEGQAGPGGERVVASAYPSRDARHLPSEARIGRDAARAAVSNQLRPDQRARLEADPAAGELVYLMLAETPILAWEFTAPLSMSPYPTRERLWVSATSGKLIEAVELVDAENLAEVFEFNPQHTPDPSLVTLTNIAAEQLNWVDETPFAETFLTGSRVRVFNCIDAPDGPWAPWRPEPEDEDDRVECYPTQQVRADAEGDFFVELPQVAIVADNIDPSDLYAELSVYYHAEKFFDFMDAMGVEAFPCAQANIVTNMHFLDPAPRYPEVEFGPLNNAYFTSSCSLDQGPTSVFGQGVAVDFGYDGDVVYHELGHGIVAGLTPEGLRLSTKRGDGLLRDARAINESLADYHTIMVTERPELAEYAGFFWPGLDRAWIRSADNQKSCPETMAGQEHNDGEPLTAALWATRYRVGGDKLDPVVLATLPLLAIDSSLEQAAAALKMVAEAERDAGVWTDADVEILDRALAARNLYDCERVIDDPASDAEPRFVYLAANHGRVSPFWPGPVQFRQVIPEGSDNLLISFDASGSGNSTGMPINYDVTPLVLVKRSSVSNDEAMHFEYDMSALGFEDEDEQVVDETWQISGDWDAIHIPTRLGQTRRQVLLRDLVPGEVVHIGFAASDSERTVLRELFLTSIPSEELDEGSPEQDPEPEPMLDDDGSGCACASAGQGGSGGAAALACLALLALVFAGRRRSPSS